MSWPRSRFVSCLWSSHTMGIVPPRRRLRIKRLVRSFGASTAGTSHQSNLRHRILCRLYIAKSESGSQLLCKPGGNLLHRFGLQFLAFPGSSFHVMHDNCGKQCRVICETVPLLQVAGTPETVLRRPPMNPQSGPTMSAGVGGRFRALSMSSSLQEHLTQLGEGQRGRSPPWAFCLFVGRAEEEATAANYEHLTSKCQRLK